MQRSSIRTFLVHAKKTLQGALSDKHANLTLVIGNQSADLDSLTSSLLYAYIRSEASQQQAYIPVTNICSKDVGLRPEFTAVLQHAYVEPDHLITLDDLTRVENGFEKQKLDKQSTRWILVDHNALEGALGQHFSSQVSGIIDHHAVESNVRLNSLAAHPEPQPRIIETSGSCSSLVTNYLQYTWDQLPPDGEALQSSEGPIWDAQLAQIAMASILIDTTNLTNKDKVTEHDTKAVGYLEDKIKSCPEVAAGFDRDQFFKEISTAKQNLDPLTAKDILRKDYKQWREGELSVGISSVVKPMQYIIDKAQGESRLLGVMDEYAKEQQLDVYVLMTAFPDTDGKFKRQIFAWGLSEAGTAAAKSFEQKSADELGLEELPLELWAEGMDTSEKKGWRKAWRQQNTKHSRKRVAPLIREEMRNVFDK